MNRAMSPAEKAAREINRQAGQAANATRAAQVSLLKAQAHLQRAADLLGVSLGDGAKEKVLEAVVLVTDLHAQVEKGALDEAPAEPNA